MKECHIIPFYTNRADDTSDMANAHLKDKEVVIRGTLLQRKEIRGVDAYIGNEKVGRIVYWQPKFLKGTFEDELGVISEDAVMVDGKHRPKARSKDLREMFRMLRK